MSDYFVKHYGICKLHGFFNETYITDPSIKNGVPRGQAMRVIALVEYPNGKFEKVDPEDLCRIIANDTDKEVQDEFMQNIIDITNKFEINLPLFMQDKIHAYEGYVEHIKKVTARWHYDKEFMEDVE